MAIMNWKKCIAATLVVGAAMMYTWGFMLIQETDQAQVDQLTITSATHAPKKEAEVVEVVEAAKDNCNEHNPFLTYLSIDGWFGKEKCNAKPGCAWLESTNFALMGRGRCMKEAKAKEAKAKALEAKKTAYQKALAVFDEAKKALEKGGEDTKQKALAVFAKALEAKKKAYQKALAVFDEAKKALEKGGEDAKQKALAVFKKAKEAKDEAKKKFLAFFEAKKALEKGGEDDKDLEKGGEDHDVEEAKDEAKKALEKGGEDAKEAKNKGEADKHKND